VAVLATALKDGRNVSGKIDVFGIDAEVSRSEKMKLVIRDGTVMCLSVQGEWHEQKRHGRNCEKMSGVHHALPWRNVPKKSFEK